MAAIAVTLDPNGDPEILKTSCKSLCVLTSSVVAANKASLSEMAAQIGSVTDEFRTLVDIATNNPRKIALSLIHIIITRATFLVCNHFSTDE